VRAPEPLRDAAGDEVFDAIGVRDVERDQRAQQAVALLACRGEISGAPVPV
jgi:hypothetical protein